MIDSPGSMDFLMAGKKTDVGHIITKVSKVTFESGKHSKDSCIG